MTGVHARSLAAHNDVTLLNDAVAPADKDSGKLAPARELRLDSAHSAGRRVRSEIVVPR
jgi:hypothetical protein